MLRGASHFCWIIGLLPRGGMAHPATILVLSGHTSYLGNCHRPDLFLIVPLATQWSVRLYEMCSFVISVMYIERGIRIRGVKDPHGSFAHSHAALDPTTSSWPCRMAYNNPLCPVRSRRRVLHSRFHWVVPGCGIFRLYISPDVDVLSAESVELRYVEGERIPSSRFGRAVKSSAAIGCRPG